MTRRKRRRNGKAIREYAKAKRKQAAQLHQRIDGIKTPRLEMDEDGELIVVYR